VVLLGMKGMILAVGSGSSFGIESEYLVGLQVEFVFGYEAEVEAAGGKGIGGMAYWTVGN
jgi:hypothetical protein